MHIIDIMKYDLIIIGAGPAGLTAAIYAGRSGLKTALISKDIGGAANSILVLENWPGFRGKGEDLMKKFYEQAKQYKTDIIIEEVQNIEKKDKEFLVKTQSRELNSDALILATGMTRTLKIPGEERLKGKGVSYCVECDGFFFKDKTAAITGKKDNIDAVLTLASLAKKVYFLFEGKEEELKKIRGNKKIEVILNSHIEEIKGKEKVEGIKINGKEIKVDAIFIETGAKSPTEFAKNLKLKLDKNNFIIVDEEMKTSVLGVFAAGDVATSFLKQVLTSSSQGAVALKSAGKFLGK
jgi:thioredoxin reductase (NADPH)